MAWMETVMGSSSCENRMFLRLHLFFGDARSVNRTPRLVRFHRAAQVGKGARGQRYSYVAPAANDTMSFIQWKIEGGSS